MDVSRSILWISLLVSTLILVSCGNLPDDFESLSLEEKVKAYESHFESYGRESSFARAYISLHGVNAAQLMTEYIQENRCCLPIMEAVEIIHLVQLRGCKLSGTKPEHVLVQLIESGKLNDADRIATMNALEDIRNNRTVIFDDLGAGLCSQP